MAEVGIFVGTVYGNALLVAEEAAAILDTLGHRASVFEDPDISDWERYRGKVVLVVISTTGQGDLPDNIRPLYQALRSTGWQPDLHYGLIALGDSGYEHFCGGGEQFDALLQEMGANRLGDVLHIDAADNPEPEKVSGPWVKKWANYL